MSLEPENNLSLLAPHFLPKVETLLSRLMQRRIYVVVIETRRSLERQQMLYDTGKSKVVATGKHLTGEAVDLAPVLVYQYGRVKEIDWDTKHPVWKEIAEIAEGLKMDWGGHWESFRDYPHFQERP